MSSLPLRTLESNSHSSYCAPFQGSNSAQLHKDNNVALRTGWQLLVV